MKLGDLQAGGFIDSESGESEAVAVLEKERAAETETPWVARIALGFGAWLAGIFFTGFIAILLDLDDEVSLGIVGFVVVVGSVFLIRQKKGVFLEQLGLALGLAGHLLFFFGLHDVHENGLMGPFFGALILGVPLYYFSRNPVQRFLSVSWVWVLGWSAGMSEWTDAPKVMPYLVFSVALAVVLLVLSGSKAFSGPFWRPAMWASVAGVIGMLFWVSIDEFGGMNEDEVGPVLGVGTALAMIGITWQLVRPHGKAVTGFVVFAVILAGLGVFGAPGVVFGLGLMTIAHAWRDRLLGWVAILALGYFLILFYYHLEISLIRKSIMLMVTGAIFLGLRLWVFRGGAGVGAEESSASEDMAARPSGNRIVQAAVIVANCVLVLAVVNLAIGQKQGIVDTGTTVFLELAPVDPRSLMQGDYMALGYALPRQEGFREAMEEKPTRGRILLKLDDKKVGVFSRYADETVEPGESEVPLKYRKWRRGWRFGIESFFFQEGLASRYEAARFAELRVSPEGEAVLVDLRGADLKKLDGDAGDDDDPGEDAPDGA